MGRIAGNLAGGGLGWRGMTGEDLEALENAGHLASLVLVILALAASDGCCTRHREGEGGGRGAGAGGVGGAGGGSLGRASVSATMAARKSTATLALRMLAALVGMGCDGYSLWMPLSSGPGQHVDVSLDHGLAVLSWAFLTGALAWAYSRQRSCRAAAVLWSATEAATGTPHLMSLAQGRVGWDLVATVAPMVCRGVILMTALMLSERIVPAGAAEGGGMEEVEAPEGGSEDVSATNLHEDGNPVAQLLLRWLTPLLVASSLRPLGLRDASRLPPDADPSALWEEFFPVWDAERRAPSSSISSSSARGASQEDCPTRGERGAGGEGGGLGGAGVLGAPPLTRALLSVLGGSAAILWGTRVVCAALELTSVVMLWKLLSHEGEGGWKLACGLGMCMLLHAMTMVQYGYYIGVEVIKANALVSSAIQRAALDSLPGDSKQSLYHATLRLACEESQRGAAVIAHLGEVIAFPFTALAVTCLLSYQLHPAAVFAGVFFILLGVPLSLQLDRSTAQAKNSVRDARDARLRALAEMVAGSAALRSMAWEHSFLDRVRVLRRAELRPLAALRWLRMANDALCRLVSPSLAAVLIVLAHSYQSGGVPPPPAQLFTALALMWVLARAARRLPASLLGVLEGGDALGRVENYCSGGLPPPLAHARPPMAHLELVLEARQASFGWPIDGSSRGGIWTVLREVNVKVKRGGRLAVYGAEGKTTLLRGLIGEARRSGDAGWVRAHGPTWYVGGTPWVIEGTVGDNVVVGTDVRDQRLLQVLSVCGIALSPTTILHLESLSLATKQRICLARAVYCGAETYLLDEPLSAVPLEERVSIIRALLRGLLRGRAVVLASSSKHLVKVAGDEALLLLRGGAAEAYPGWQVKEGRDACDRDEAFDQMTAAMEKMREYDAGAGVSGARSSVGAGAGAVVRAGGAEGCDVESLMEQESRQLADLPNMNKERGARGAIPKYVEAFGPITACAVILLMVASQGATSAAHLALAAWEDVQPPNVTAAWGIPSRPTRLQDGPVLGGLWSSGRLGEETWEAWVDLCGRDWLIFFCGACIASAMAGMVALALGWLGEQKASKSLLEQVMLSIAQAGPTLLFDKGVLHSVVLRFKQEESSIDDNLPTLIRMCTLDLVKLMACIATLVFACPASSLATPPLLLLLLYTQTRYSRTQDSLSLLSRETTAPLLFRSVISSAKGARDIRCAHAADRFSPALLCTILPTTAFFLMSKLLTDFGLISKLLTARPHAIFAQPPTPETSTRNFQP